VSNEGTVAASGAAKVSVCHRQGSGYNLIDIATAALRAHLAHGDKVPVNGSCSAPPPAACPCFTTVEIDSTSCGDLSAVTPLCPQQIYDQYGLPVVEVSGGAAAAAAERLLHRMTHGYSCGHHADTRNGCPQRERGRRLHRRHPREPALPDRRLQLIRQN
jgi:hypothetical protein